MRTKTLLIAAAALAAGLMVSSAQTYSQNVVGYVNLNLGTGFNMVANQLDADGTGTNNTIQGVFSNSLPPGSYVYKYVDNGWVVSSYAKSGHGTGATTNWDSNGILSANPGEGLFVQVPSPVTASVVGIVLQGALSNPNIPPAGGFCLLSAQVPIAGDITTNLDYIPQLNDYVFLWNPADNGGQGGFDSYSYAKSGHGTGAVTNWSPSLQIGVGQGLFLDTSAGSSWPVTFNVQ